MHFESMESRRLLAATAFSVKNGVLTVSGGSKADVISVFESGGGNVHIDITDVAHNVFRSENVGGISAIKINGGGKQDTIFYTGTQLGAVIHGNGGDDNISVTDGAAASQVFGDNGDDTITLLHGNQTQISGGSGNDTIALNTDPSALGGTSLTDAGKGDDVVNVVSGANTINGSDGKDTVIIDVPDADPRDVTDDGFALASQQVLIKVETVTFI